MLGRLLKYDMKSLSRFLVIIHIILLISAVLGRVFLTGRIEFTSEGLNLNSTLLGLSFLLFFVIFMSVSFGTYIIIAVRFYKNLFSDEGYLTRTLPVTPGAHLLSKTIAGFIWSAIDTLLIFLSMWIIIATPSVVNAFEENKAEVLDLMGFSNSFTPGMFFFYIVFIFTISCFSSVIMLYLSVALGQLFSNHRILGAVVCYFVMNMAISIITTMILILTGFFKRYDSTFGVSPAAQGGFNIAEYMMDTYIFVAVLSIVTGIILYVLTYYIMKKKTNLE